jgi:hypothetical protein
VGRLGKRLKQLEERSEGRAAEDEDLKKRRQDLGLWYRTYENELRQKEGLPPVPLSVEERRWLREADEEDGAALEKYFDGLEEHEERRAKNTGGSRRWGS